MKPNRYAIHSLWAAILLAALLGGPWASPARAMIEWRISVKVFLDSSNRWPASTASFNLCSESAIRSVFAEYNTVLDRGGRGFRFKLEEIQTIASSDLYDADPGNKDSLNLLTTTVNLYRPSYQYRPDAINVYVSHSTGSGVTYGGPLPGPDVLLGNIILVGKQPMWSTVMHEILHAMDLCHTHGCCNSCDDCGNQSQDDKIGDTIKDMACWTKPQLIQENFGTGKDYNNITAAERRKVDDVWNNIMSYHSEANGTNRTRLTAGQWEHLVDVSNYQRITVASGRTWFIDAANTCGLPSDVQQFLNDRGKDLQWLIDNHYLNPFEWGTRNSTPQSFSVTIPAYNNCLSQTTVKVFNPLTGKWQYQHLLPDGALFWSDDLCVSLPEVKFQSSLFCLGGPWRSIGETLGYVVVQDKDRLQIKAGNYNEKLRITRPITLTASGGKVTIGRP